MLSWSLDRSTPADWRPPRAWGQLCRCWPRGGGLCGMFARRGEQGSSVCPCARPGAWNAGVVGRGKRKPAVRLGLGRQGGAGAKAAPAGLPSALAAPITTADPRMQEVGTEDKPKQKPFPKLPPDPPCAGVRPSRSTRAAHRQNQRLPCGRLAPDHRHGCAKQPHRRRAAVATAQPPPNAKRVAGRTPAARFGAQRCLQANRLWTGGSRCPHRPSS